MLGALLIFLYLPSGFTNAQDQSKEQLRSQAESQLEKMTPAEIEQKLKDIFRSVAENPVGKETAGNAL